MTPEIAEEAAKTLCRLLGLDPDERVPDPSNFTTAFVTVPRWHVLKHEVIRFEMVREAIFVARVKVENESVAGRSAHS